MQHGTTTKSLETQIGMMGSHCITFAVLYNPKEDGI